MVRKKRVIRCQKCSYENTPDSKFCQNCGKPLQITCPACSTINAHDAKYCKNCGAKLELTPVSTSQNRLATLQQAAPKALQQKIYKARSNMDSERKPVVILFTDIVDSTGLAEKLDPEDWREIVSGAHERVIQSVYRYEGTIAQLLGDGVLVFFGAPITHEDDPLRAVHAGLEIQKLMESYREMIKEKAPNFQLRVGINTGLVVVGDIGNDLHIEYLALGDAVNLAARLQSLAPSGRVVISDSIYQLVSHSVECSDLGLFTIKGKEDPVHVHQVNHFRDNPLISPEIAESVGAMVGRDTELSQLESLTEAVQAGIGRAALVIGEPGVGKSRLVSEWRSWVGDTCGDRIIWVEAQCPSYGARMAYSIVIQLLLSLLKTPVDSGEMSTKVALKKLTKKIFAEDAVDNFTYLGHLMGLELDDKELKPIRGMDPPALQVQYLGAIQQLLMLLSRKKPILLLCEDLQWADSSSIDLLIKLLPVLHEAPIFFCLTTRQDLDAPGWQLVTAMRSQLGAGLAELPLTSLSANLTEQMMASLLSVDQPPREVVQLVFEKTEGNPLFVEEVVRTLIEEGGLIQIDADWIIGKEIARLEIPDSLKRLVLARIDRLDNTAKRVARVASVIGRQFMVRVLEQVMAKNQFSESSQLTTHLSVLEATDLIHLLSTRPDLVYLFKHALIHEAIYEAVLKTDRTLLHRAVAEVLEASSPDRIDELAATLGYHYSQGEIHDRAEKYLAQAAAAAKARYANLESITLYRLAISELHQELNDLGNGSEPSEHMAELYESMAEVLSLIGQHEEAVQLYQQALEVLPISNRKMRSLIYRKMGNAYVIPRRLEDALKAYEMAESALGSISAEADPDFLNAWIDTQLDQVYAQYFLANISGMNSSIEKVRPYIEKYGTALAKAVFYQNLVLLAYRRDRYLVSDETVNDARRSVTAAREAGELSVLTFSTFIFGFCHLWRHELDIAEENFKTALGLAEKIGDMERKVLSLTYLTVVYRQFNDVEKTAQLTTRSMEAATSAKMPPYIGMAQTNLTWILWKQGKYDEAERLGSEVVDKYASSPAPIAMLVTMPLVDIFLIKERKAEAFKLIGKVVDYFFVNYPGLEEAMHQVIHSWEVKDEVTAMDHLTDAILIARKNGLM